MEPLSPVVRRLALAGAISGFLAVAAGAFGAHALKARLAAELLVVFETGVRYHLAHVPALFAAAWVASRHPGRAAVAAGWCFAAGTLVFSGSLYVLALTGVRAWGAVTPVGGTLFLAGWALLAAGLAGRPR